MYYAYPGGPPPPPEHPWLGPVILAVVLGFIVFALYDCIASFHGLPTIFP